MSPIPASSRQRWNTSTRRSASTASAACTSTTPTQALAPTATGTRRSGPDRSARVPAFQGLPAILETPGPEGNGPDAAEVAALRALHKRGIARAKRRRTRQ
jgi:hypothetical protein